MPPALHPVFAPIDLEVKLVWARLDRAKEQAKTLRAGWGHYLDDKPHSLQHTRATDGTLTVRLRRDKPLPVDLSVILGELLYELRAALDNCLYAVAALVSGENPPPDANRLEWPIRTTSADWKSQLGRYRSLPTEIVSALEAIQPFQARYPHWNSLALLHELARIDRHRSMHGLGLYLSHLRLMVDRREIEVLDQGQPRVVRDGDSIVELRLNDGAVLTPKNFNLELEFELEMDNVQESSGPGGFTGRPWGSLDKRLMSLIQAVHEYTTDLLNIAADLVEEAQTNPQRAEKSN